MALHLIIFITGQTNVYQCLSGTLTQTLGDWKITNSNNLFKTI